MPLISDLPRILIGPIFNPALLGEWGHHPHVRTFALAEHGRAQPWFTYQASDTFAEFWARLPKGWEPQLLVWWDAYYQPLPPGIADCPIPSWVIPGDWNVHTLVTRDYLTAFDGVVAETPLLSQLDAQQPRILWPGFAFDPALHRPLHLERVWDVTFIGNLNHALQQGRSTYLERLARLSGWRIQILGGVYGDAYVRLLNQSRVVFNHSIRGEMNMRAFEAPACGALLLMEADNQELAAFLQPGESCLTYTAENFEQVVTAILGDEPRRAQIAAAGQAAIQGQGYPERVGQLLRQLAPMLASWAGPQARRWHRLPLWQQQVVAQAQRGACGSAAALSAARQALGAESHPALLHLAGVLALRAEQPEQALSLFNRVLADPLAQSQPLPWLNRARLWLQAGHPHRALADLAQLPDNSPDPLWPATAPRPFGDRLTQALESIWQGRSSQASAGLVKAEAELLAAQLEPTREADHWQASLNADSSRCEPWVFQARRAVQVQNWPLALLCWEQAAAAQAFLVEAWMGQAEALARLGLWERLHTHLESLEPIFAVNASFAPALVSLRRYQALRALHQVLQNPCDRAACVPRLLAFGPESEAYPLGGAWIQAPVPVRWQSLTPEPPPPCAGIVWQPEAQEVWVRTYGDQEPPPVFPQVAPALIDIEGLGAWTLLWVGAEPPGDLPAWEQALAQIPDAALVLFFPAGIPVLEGLESEDRVPITVFGPLSIAEQRGLLAQVQAVAGHPYWRAWAEALGIESVSLPHELGQPQMPRQTTPVTSWSEVVWRWRVQRWCQQA